ncbi:MAG TPA: glycosyltransferase family 2 protein [Acidobacteriota bacterium]|nr:glycosyltransferase family 2 protein [Acidobacteriota bacterium]
MDPEISIIVPCLNEEQNIPILVDKLTALIDYHNLSAEILIVDDCSDDYTFREAFILSDGNKRVRALHKGLPRGIGRGIRFGIDQARGKVGVVVMGDLVDPLAAIPDFRDQIVNHGYNLVLLSRYIDPGDHANIPTLYRFYQFWFRLLCRLWVGVRLTDITYAFRGFDLNYVRSLQLESQGFEISPEITLKTWLSGGRICELKGRQGRRIQGESKFVFSRQGMGYATVLLKAVAKRLTGRWPQKKLSSQAGHGPGMISLNGKD